MNCKIKEQMDQVDQYLQLFRGKVSYYNWLMSKCVCISCGYESFILCCAERPIYYSLCLPCLSSVSFMGLTCQGCSKPISTIVYRLQKQIALEQNNRNPHFINSSFRKDSHRKESSDPFKQQSAPTSSWKKEYGSQLHEVATTKMNSECWISNEEIRKAAECFDKPINYEVHLERQRKKNNLPVGNMKTPQKWEDSSSEYSEQSIW